MTASEEWKRINMGGIKTAVYNLDAALASPYPVGVLIATHGRERDQFQLKNVIKRMIQEVNRLEQQGKGKRKREMVVVTLVSPVAPAYGCCIGHVRGNERGRRLISCSGPTESWRETCEQGPKRRLD